MQTPPRLTPDAALFLDFDGTLVDIAETPEAIEVPQRLVPLLTDLHDLLGGALAVVSGRQIDVLDRFLAPLRLPAAGEHGVQRRDAEGQMQEQRAARPRRRAGHRQRTGRASTRACWSSASTRPSPCTTGSRPSSRRCAATPWRA